MTVGSYRISIRHFCLSVFLCCLFRLWSVHFAEIRFPTRGGRLTTRGRLLGAPLSVVVACVVGLFRARSLISKFTFSMYAVYTVVASVFFFSLCVLYHGCYPSVTSLHTCEVGNRVSRSFLPSRILLFIWLSLRRGSRCVFPPFPPPSVGRAICEEDRGVPVAKTR